MYLGIKRCYFFKKSVRKFTDEKIDDAVIRKIILAGIYAPNACNFQAWKFIVIDNKKIIQQFNNPVANAAPCCIAVVYRNDFLVSGNKHKDYIQSASAAIQNMLLVIHELGLGACWLCHFPEQKIMRELLAVPQNFDVVALIALGKPLVGDENSLERKIYHYDNIQHFDRHDRRYNLDQVICYNEFCVVEGDITHKKYLLDQIGKIFRQSLFLKIKTFIFGQRL